jgi:hypothetical protein
MGAVVSRVRNAWVEDVHVDENFHMGQGDTVLPLSLIDPNTNKKK